MEAEAAERADHLEFLVLFYLFIHLSVFFFVQINTEYLAILLIKLFRTPKRMYKVIY